MITETLSAVRPFTTVPPENTVKLTLGGLFTVTGIFGLGFSGIIPAYVLALREFFPAREAGWRVPILLCMSGFGMASGGWVAGLIYDHFGYYAPAFGFGLAVNAVNLVLVGTLVARRHLDFGSPRPAFG